MALAILKLSYASPGDSAVVGGICGTAFFVNQHEGLTAYHVVNERTFEPNDGFKHARLWLVSQDGYIGPLGRDCVEFHPELDVTLITQDHVPRTSIYPLALKAVIAGMKVRGFGYVGNVMPETSAQWIGDELMLSRVNLSPLFINVGGSASGCHLLNVDAVDVKLTDVSGFEVSFASRVGMSGGPVISAAGGDAVGLLSFGLPVDEQVKTATFAIGAHEIANRLFSR